MVNDLIWAGLVRRVLVSRVVDACTPSDEDHGNGRRSDRGGQRVLVSRFAIDGNWVEVRGRRVLASRFAIDGNWCRSSLTHARHQTRATAMVDDLIGAFNGHWCRGSRTRELVSRFMDVFTPSAMVDDDQGWCNGN